MIAHLIQLTLVGLLVLSPLVVHEMGHWALLRRYGVPVRQVWLGLGPVLLKWKGFRVGMLPIGGAVVPDAALYQALKPRHRMMVALAGPVFSCMYGILLLMLAAENPELVRDWTALEGLAALNFVLAGLNLIPVPPLDGYHALAAWYEEKGDPLSERVQRFATRLGNGFVFGIGFLVLGSVFIR